MHTCLLRATAMRLTRAKVTANPSAFLVRDRSGIQAKLKKSNTNALNAKLAHFALRTPAASVQIL
jgi:hypothetical protein